MLLSYLLSGVSDIGRLQQDDSYSQLFRFVCTMCFIIMHNVWHFLESASQNDIEWKSFLSFFK